MTEELPGTDRPAVERERWELLRQLQTLLEGPLTALGFVWLGLLILDLTAGLNRPLQVLSNGIWALFVLDFLSRLMIAPTKATFLRGNWLTAISLLLPALRVLRVFRAFRLLRATRATRSVSLLRLLTSLNRGMRALGTTLGRRGVGYVASLTLIVTVSGAAGMAYFESPAALGEAGLPQREGGTTGLADYGEALWWTAMLMTTLGSEYWPRTVEGRVLAFLLALYAFAVFGYLTATIASFFIGQDQAAARTPAAVDQVTMAELATLRREVVALRSELATLRLQPGPPAMFNPPVDREPEAARRTQPRGVQQDRGSQNAPVEHRSGGSRPEG
jgi:voltage-gated potassium channel